MSKLYVHCGLHKTGTTALQRFLAENRQTLQAAGFYYPRTGVVGAATGHHNLAWELMRDRRYAPHRGNLEALAQEIAPVGQDVVLSSEDFESLMLRPHAWEPLTRLAGRTGRKLVLIVYVQNQADYLEALYLQCLKAGSAEEFTAVAEEALEQGVVRRREWTFHFERARPLEQLLGLGADVVVRSYHQLVGGSTVTDFLTVIGAPLHLFSETELMRRVHTRQALPKAIFNFYKLRVERDPNRRERMAIGWMAEPLPQPKAPPEILAQFANAFQLSNRTVCRRFGVPEQGLVTPAPPPPVLTDFARVFSLETQMTINELAGRVTLLPDDRSMVVDPPSKALYARWAAWVTEREAPAPTFAAQM